MTFLLLHTKPTVFLVSSPSSQSSIPHRSPLVLTPLPSPPVPLHSLTEIIDSVFYVPVSSSLFGWCFSCGAFAIAQNYSPFFLLLRNIPSKRSQIPRFKVTIQSESLSFTNLQQRLTIQSTTYLCRPTVWLVFLLWCFCHRAKLILILPALIYQLSDLSLCNL